MAYVIELEIGHLFLLEHLSATAFRFPASDAL